MNELLNLIKVGLTYQSKNGETEALKDISLKIKEQEFVAIVGPSGCGKTTILSLISGLIKATKGSVQIAGKDVSQAKNLTGYMFQRDHLFEWRTIWQNVVLGLEINKKNTKDNQNFVMSLIEKYGLKDFANKYPRELSGGMRQRVALIRTLALNPPILLLDEPFSALDYQTRLKVCDDVAGIIKNEKKTAVLVTHDISEAISMADRVIVLSNRPATIKAEFVIDMPAEKPLQRRENSSFAHIFDKIWKELQDWKN